MIECMCVVKRLGGRLVLDGINLKVQRGEILVLCGPSGTGKTTLLRALNGLEPIDSGTIVVDKIPLDSKQNARSLNGRVGMLFQHFNLFEHLTALENTSLAPKRVLGIARKEAERRARDLLAEFGLADRVHHLPSQLSGGEKQRVALARCLAMRPSVMLMDEPTSALDPSRATQVAELIKRLKRENMTTVIVTHDQHFAYQVADRMVSLEQGRLVDIAQDPSCCAEPGELHAEFVGSHSYMPAPRPHGQGTGGAAVPVPA
jgi:ABC-type polar amino acid transport system ATPase subunit